MIFSESQGKSGGVPASGSKKININIAINGIIKQHNILKIINPLIILLIVQTPRHR